MTHTISRSVLRSVYAVASLDAATVKGPELITRMFGHLGLLTNTATLDPMTRDITPSRGEYYWSAGVLQLVLGDKPRDVVTYKFNGPELIRMGHDGPDATINDREQGMSSMATDIVEAIRYAANG